LTAETNKAVVRRLYEELLDAGDLGAADRLCAPEYVAHFLPPGATPGIEGLKQLVGLYRAALPDLHFELEDLVAEGDTVAARATTSGTHLGPFMGAFPTGRRVTVAGIDTFRLADGRIVEQWLNRDDLGLLQHLGVLPPLPPQQG